MNTLRFQEACKEVLESPPERRGIGTLGEKTLHAVLKRYLEPHETNHEVKIGRYVADIVGEDGVIEIQTRNFSALRGKLSAFLEVCPVTVVYPVAQVKWLFWMDPLTGEVSGRRKSPKKGIPHDVFFELYKIRPLLGHPNFRLKIVMLEMEEIKSLDGFSKNRKCGASRLERIPVSLLGEVEVRSPHDYLQFIPAALPRPFTSLDFHKETGLSLSAARTALLIMSELGVVERCGKQGRAFLYDCPQKLI